MPASRVLISLAIAGVVVAGFSACANDTVATPTETNSSAATPAPTQSAEPTATPTAEPVGTPVTIGCETLITAQELYDWDPNFVPQTTYKPVEGSDAATIVDDQGIACAWVQQTSGQIVEVAVASLPEEELTTLKNAFVLEVPSVPTYGDPLKVEGYFQPGETFGHADVFSGPYWISADSDAFFEPGDALPIIEAALAGLGQPE
ncbi:hypothetical protein HD599_000978 [Conyzicola lurida]|uniref:BIG2 domain-containing protein n=1 Tax=Conyzicola lurida TaxID=1172621 RepID=A0A841AMA7_9MICO|nr:iron ABC transporter ATP-binding protein [Conyzicola lurida]MBB5842655.1 hypothetical protein [Conyzicola lurida]